MVKLSKCTEKEREICLIRFQRDKPPLKSQQVNRPSEKGNTYVGFVNKI